MPFERKLVAVLGLGAVVLAALPVLAQRGPDSGPVARYDMRAGTLSGFAAMGGGMGGGMSAMFGGGGDKVQHELYLRLGSSRAADKGEAKADHFMPPNAKLGKSVALVAPQEEKAPDEFPQGQRPKGRLLLFWGCGEHAPKGQPVVIDFAKLAAGQMPTGLWSSTVIRDWGPNKTNSKSFARWPAEDRKFVKPDSALPGPHRVAGNFSPEIAFTLTKDFMAALKLTSASQPSGAALLNWGAVPDATGYLAVQFRGKRGPGGDQGDMVMWTSSATRQFGGGLGDWLTVAQAAALVKDRTLMAPTTTTCTVPAEVKQAGPDFGMGMLTAFGPEENFSYPPRPADPKAPWNLEWTARIRHRSTTGWMDIPGMASASEQGQSTPEQPKCKPRGGLGGMLGGVLKSGC